jgi:hypothetical protein
VIGQLFPILATALLGFRAWTRSARPSAIKGRARFNVKVNGMRAPAAPRSLIRITVRCGST